MAYQAAAYQHGDGYYQHSDDPPAPPPEGEFWDPEALGHALLTDESHSDWSAVTNLDAFFCKVYTYYVEKGFWCMIAARITNLLTLAFTISFSTFLLLFVNWHAFFFCDSGDCDAIVSFRAQVFTSPSPADILVFTYFGVFCVYWLWNFLSFFYTLRDALEMRTFYKEDLEIDDDDLVSLEWHYILDRLVSVSARKKLCIVKDLTSLDITNRIMRKENYMIAMVNMDLLQFGPRDNMTGKWTATAVCCPRKSKMRPEQEMKETKKVLRERGTRHATGANPAASPPARSLQNPLLHETNPSAAAAAINVHTTSVPVASSSYSTFHSPTAASASVVGPSPPSSRQPTVGGASGPTAADPFTSWWSWAIMGTTLDWNIRFCVLNSLFDSHFYVHSAYLGPSGVSSLKARFICLGVANLLLSPFILLFMIIFFFLRHAEELHSKKTLFGPRQWCNLAQWKMREFNELPHFFERRLTLSSVAAQQYMQQFPNTLVSIIAQSVAYITGALVAILLLLTVTDSDIITHRIFDRTLLWYLAVFSAVLALSRSMIPDKSIYPAPALVMQEVVKHTHYSPPHWRYRTHTSAVHREFTYMYPSRLSMFCFEVMSVIMTPLVLIFCMPNAAERIVQFVATRTINVQGVGHLCSYAMFDIEKHGDARYSHVPHVNFPTTTTDPDAHTSAEQRQRADGKDARTSSSSSSRPPVSAPAPPSFPLRLKHGKIEKSFLAFSMANPHWKPVSQEDGGSGAKFLSGLADTIYGRDDFTPPQFSRDASQNASPNKFRPAGSVRFARHDDGGNDEHAAAPKLPLPASSSTFLRQDSLDSQTAAEERFDADEEADDPERHAKASASYMLSQSDRHLIQSFADLVGMDPTMQSTLHPSTLLRQSSTGGGMGSMVGMSTMLGLNARRPYAQSQRAMQQSMMRSQLATSLYHPSNSVLLSSSMMPRATGGLQGGLSASSLLHMDTQSVREQLMLAQADQQADLFALLENRLDEETAECDEEEAHESQHADADRQAQADTSRHHSRYDVHATSDPTRGGDRPDAHQQAPHSHSHPREPSAVSAAAAAPSGHFVKSASFDGRQYGTSTLPSASSHLSSHASAAHDDDGNEPPPTSFFN